MATSLFDSIIFGPVRSRRLGISLGINLLPIDNKLCNFNCIYCECGWNTPGTRPVFHSREKVRQELERVLAQMCSKKEELNVITFAGNGEPTMHPDFETVIEDTVALRDRYSPEARVAVLSNATMLGKEPVFRALCRVDDNILKLDSAFDDTARKINQPNSPSYSVENVVSHMERFNGDFILQTMFLTGDCNGIPVDNTTDREVNAWLKIVDRLCPRMVMIYTIDRDTPADGLKKASSARLAEIAERVRGMGIECSVSG